MQILEVLAVIADIVWKGAAGGLVIVTAPKFLAALKTWHQIKTQQLQTQLEIEREHRTLAEKHATLASGSVEILTRESESLRRLLSSAEAERGEVIVRQITDGRASDATVTLRGELMERLLETFIGAASYIAAAGWINRTYQSTVLAASKEDSSTESRLMRIVDRIVKDEPTLIKERDEATAEALKDMRKALATAGVSEIESTIRTRFAPFPEAAERLGIQLANEAEGE